MIRLCGISLARSTDGVEEPSSVISSRTNWRSLRGRAAALQCVHYLGRMLHQELAPFP